MMVVSEEEAHQTAVSVRRRGPVNGRTNPYNAKFDVSTR